MYLHGFHKVKPGQAKSFYHVTADAFVEVIGIEMIKLANIMSRLFHGT